MKLYHTILVITAALFASAAIAAPSSDFNFGSKMRNVAYQPNIQIVQNAPLTNETPSLQNKKHHSSHTKFFHKNHKKSK
jgi:hypothetical protein